jgi:SnoaL-like domain
MKILPFTRLGHRNNWQLIAIAFFAGMLSVVSMMVLTQSKEAKAASSPTLTALDYIEIEQLVNRYPHAQDTCFNDGYDYADLYTADGVFIDKVSDDGFNKGGVVRARGREQLAGAVGGGKDGCQKPKKGKFSTPGDGAFAWNGWSHLAVNHVVNPSPEGATGRVYLFMLGAADEPNKMVRAGGYEDIYVKTPQGWRIKQRTHVRARAWHNPSMQTVDLK